MAEFHRFLLLMAVSIVVVAVIISSIAPKCARKTPVAIAIVSAIIAAGGMTFAKIGADHALPVALYYGVPAALTIFLPPWYFRMPFRRAVVYIILAFLSAPAIHFSAFYLLGWDNYMPFLNRGA